MPQPYPSDLRQRAIALVEAGLSRRAVAKLLALNKSTVILWVKEFRATGKQAAAAMGGCRRFALLEQRDWLLARIAAAPDLSSHKGTAVRQAIRDARAHLLFLPPYSPDLNPIEMVFAKLKTLLRKADERSIAAVWPRIGSLLDHFAPSECANYLRHAGYDQA